MVTIVTVYHCHGCDESFTVDGETAHGTYEFRRCPRCHSAKTTLADR